MRRTPLLPVVLALIVGIVVAKCGCHNMVLWAWALAACTVASGVAAVVKPLGMRVAAWCATLAVIPVGALLLLNSTQHDWASNCDKQTFLEVQLQETPQPRPRSIRAKATVLRKGEEERRASGAITLYFRPDSVGHSLRYGDRILMHGYPDTARRSCYTTSDHYNILHRDTTSLRARCEAIRMRLLHRMQGRPMPPDEAAVAAALALGWRANIDVDTQTAFRDAGIAHLLAVSGLHVGLLAAMVGWLARPLGRLRKGRITRGAVQLVAIWGFTLLSGFAPSTVRAALMFSLFCISDITERRTPPLNLLAATAIITLCCSPTLLFDLGWQLSYSAVAGILLAMPAIRSLRTRVGQSAAVSVAATVATLPVVCATFHRLPVYFLIANVVVVPFAGVVLLLSLLYTAWPCTALGWLTGLAVRLIKHVCNGVAALPGAVVENITPMGIELAFITLIAAALLLSAQLINKSKSR